MITTHRDARQYLVDYLRRDLVGPNREDEVLTDIPTTHYLTGILYPRDTRAAPEEDNDSDAASEAEDDTDIGAPQLNAALPSAIGISFVVAGHTEPFLVRAHAARYIEEEQQADGTAADDSKRRKHWRRVPVQLADGLLCSSFGIRKEVLCEGLQLQVLVRPAGSDRLVTATLVNLHHSVPGATGNPPADRCFFQPYIQVTSHPEGRPVFVAREPAHLHVTDADIALNRLLYRDALEYAAGHGCAVEWEPRVGEPPTAIASCIIPDCELPQVIAEQSFEGPALEMAWLAAASPANLGRELTMLVERYAHWIERIRTAAQLIDPGYAPTADQNITRCAEAYERMRKGIDLIAADPVVREAFQLACSAMRDQRRQTLIVKRSIRPGDPVDARWRPFQLAFILMCLASVTDPKDPFRDTVDLLWFPTGGGKTEAYLGLTAYAIMLRRLQAHPEQGEGTTVLMRYTLRLLTIQQFQRAATLICALDLMRQQDAARLGTIPITVGLWVGGDTTPNTMKQADEAVTRLKAGQPVLKGNPKQLESCPWCGTALLVKYFDIPAPAVRLIIRCPAQDCPFHSGPGLPVRVVDEDMYREPPGLLIGVVDKFAQMPWNSKVGRLFGRETAAAPPSLIIQDEMHLISGPLGTLVGLYETAVDLLASTDDGGPKVIASTATIRRAEDQSRNLFNRDVRQFPPPGLEARDSFFAVARPLEELPGRLYLGVQAPGRSGKTIQLRIMAALLQAVHTMDAPADIRDPYFTLVGYYNSMRELGGAVRLVEDDVTERIKVLAQRESRQERHIEPAQELTSRRDSSEIPGLLNLMARTIDDGAIDVLLATNMISVGVDVDRLSLMLVVGQPKTTAEYIQATSRVGRRYPGLVVTMYVASRPRDRSHYERFAAYHAAIYSQVEATSVTPFSARARDRGLHAVLIALIRHTLPGMNGDYAAGKLDRTQVRPVIKRIIERVKQVEENEVAATAEELDDILDRWDRLIGLYGDRLRYGQGYGRTASEPCIMYSADRQDQHADAEEALSFPTLNSLREVEPACNVYLLKGS